MKLLFHCCCAPCTLGCLGSLLADSITPVLFWYNPNIHPWTEYARRRDTLRQFGVDVDLETEMIDEYGLRSFIGETFSVMRNGPESAGAERCAVCYRLRLEKTAAYASEKKFDAFSTSLLVSRYQKHDAIRALGEELADKYHIPFFYRDFRPGFRVGLDRARAVGLYMQKYCGCIFSEEERYLSAPKPAKNQHTTSYDG